ncbi:hypothetical protein KC571_03990, partial [candidate division WWE3 bacterium]|nr:hypothetical protein [candidate division WWE3 bacterium]
LIKGGSPMSFNIRTAWPLAILMAVLLLCACGGAEIATNSPSAPSASALATYRIKCVDGEETTLWEENGQFSSVWSEVAFDRKCKGNYEITTTYNSAVDASFIEVVVFDGWDSICYVENVLNGHYSPSSCVDKTWYSVLQGETINLDQTFIIRLWAPDAK